MLCDSEIKNYCIEMGIVEPFVELNLQPSSLDLTLGNEFIINVGLDTEETIVADSYIIRPQEFILGTTVETFNLPRHITAKVCGKSTGAREGKAIEFAGHIDPGFFGQITFEIVNHGARERILKSGDIVAQAEFFVHRPCTRDYREKGGHYQGQEGVTPSWRGTDIGYWK